MSTFQPRHDAHRRHLSLALVLAVAAVAAVFAGGCASRDSMSWAQNAPLIKADPNGTPIVSLGTMR